MRLLSAQRGNSCFYLWLFFFLSSICLPIHPSVHLLPTQPASYLSSVYHLFPPSLSPFFSNSKDKPSTLPPKIPAPGTCVKHDSHKSVGGWGHANRTVLEKMGLVEQEAAARACITLSVDRELALGSKETAFACLSLCLLCLPHLTLPYTLSGSTCPLL